MINNHWDKYPKQSGSCLEGTTRYYGHDPRGWAWGLYAFSAAGYYFNDYKIAKTVSGAQTSMDWEFVYGIRATGDPVGAIVMGGYHAIDLVGYQTLNDPFTETQKTLYGFYMFDPFYNSGWSDPPPSPWPSGGFMPNHYATISDWNSKYYLPDTHDGPSGNFWYNTYDGVLRASGSSAPSDTPPESYGDYVYNNLFGALPDPSLLSAADDTGAKSLKSAVDAGLQQNALGDSATLGVNLSKFALGNVAHVRSLDPSLPSYDLVELRVGGQTRAVALVNETARGFEFGEISATSSEPPLMSATHREEALYKAGLHGSGELVWAPSATGLSPFQPFIEGQGANGVTAYLTARGVTGALQLVAR